MTTTDNPQSTSAKLLDAELRIDLANDTIAELNADLDEANRRAGAAEAASAALLDTIDRAAQDHAQLLRQLGRVNRFAMALRRHHDHLAATTRQLADAASTHAYSLDQATAAPLLSRLDEVRDALSRSLEDYLPETYELPDTVAASVPRVTREGHVPVRRDDGIVGCSGSCTHGTASPS